MGRYVNNNLLRNEQVIFESTYHWIFFLAGRLYSRLEFTL